MKPVILRLIITVIFSIWFAQALHDFYYLDDISNWIWSKNLSYPEGVITPWQPIGEHDGVEIYALYSATFFCIIVTYGLSLIARSSIRLALTLLLVLIFLRQVINIYLNYQESRVKEQSLILSVKQNPFLQKATIIWVEGEFLTKSKVAFESTSNASNILILPITTQSQAIVMSSNTEIDVRKLAQFPQIDILGCQASIKVFKGDRQHDKVGLVIRYLGLRIFRPQQLDTFLQSLIYLRVTPIHSNLASNCQTW